MTSGHPGNYTSLTDVTIDLYSRSDAKGPKGKPSLRDVDAPGVRLPLRGAPALVIEDALRALECLSEGYRLDVTFTAV